MKANINKFVVLALTLSLSLAGCISTVEDQLGLASNGGDGNNLAITLTGTNATADISHLGLAFKGIFVHEAGAAEGDGYYEITLSSGHADLVDGDAVSLQVANGSAPAGEYDHVMLRLRQVEAMGSDGGDHEHADNASEPHDHDDAGNGSETGLGTGAVDIPINVTFELTNELTHLEFVFDAGASTADGEFFPVVTKVNVERGGEIVQSIDAPTVSMTGEAGDGGQVVPPGERPVARVSVFAPNGDQAYEADFLAEDGAFVNSKSNPFELGKDLRFSGTDSEAIAKGATLETYQWDFDDGTTATGANVAHNWTQPGVFEVSLTVTDSRGGTDSQTLRLVFLQTEWTAELVNNSFEEGPGDWVAQSNGDTTWELDGPGRDSDTSWHVGNHAIHVQGTPAEGTGAQGNAPGYSAGAEATLTSPAIEIPANWSSAGFKFYLAGASEGCCDQLTVKYTIEGGGGGQLGTFGGVNGWFAIDDIAALATAAGKSVTFTFTFTSDDLVETGDGWYFDDFVIGGVDLPLHKAELLEQGGHDGHDHEH